VSVDAYGFKIDGTEVTNADYALFLAANVPPQSVTTSPSHCAWNETYVPKNGWPATGEDNLPVVWVDRCDAYAFCEWAGKRLCGKIGGAPDEPIDDWGTPTQSEWFNGCLEGKSGSGYPYGPAYDGSICNGVDYGAAAPIPPKQANQCHGSAAPYDAIFDMSGNVAEWAERISGSTIVTVRGGSFANGDFQHAACQIVELITNVSESDARGDIGFRCCGD
jgi:formylglycine-generating enzyme required for sulfatase activity